MNYINELPLDPSITFSLITQKHHNTDEIMLITGILRQLGFNVTMSGDLVNNCVLVDNDIGKIIYKDNYRILDHDFKVMNKDCDKNLFQLYYYIYTLLTNESIKDYVTSIIFSKYRSQIINLSNDHEYKHYFYTALTGFYKSPGYNELYGHCQSRWVDKIGFVPVYNHRYPIVNCDCELHEGSQYGRLKNLHNHFDNSFNKGFTRLNEETKVDSVINNFIITAPQNSVVKTYSRLVQFSNQLLVPIEEDKSFYERLLANTHAEYSYGLNREVEDKLNNRWGMKGDCYTLYYSIYDLSKCNFYYR